MGRFDRCKPATISGISERASQVVSMSNAPNAGSQRSRGSSRRAAWSDIFVPRVQSIAKKWVSGMPAEAKLRRIGSAYRDRAGSQKIIDNW